MRRKPSQDEIEMMRRRVPETRKEKGLSIEQCSRLAGRDPTEWSALENGNLNPVPFDMWQAVVYGLGLTEGRGTTYWEQVSNLTFEDIKSLLLPEGPRQLDLPM